MAVPQAAAGSRRIVLVEDNDAVASMLGKLLEHRGWSVDLASTLAEAEFHLQQMPHCIILDLGLPDGEGEQLLRRLRMERIGVRVIVITGVLDEQRLEGVRELEPTALLRKPVSLGELLAHLPQER